MKQVIMYTDGACSGNPGPGGWGVILMYQGHKVPMSGSADNTTNNRMELLAVIRGLEALKEYCDITIYSDSKYVVNGINEWLDGWIARNWKTAGKKPVKNRDLWEQLVSLRTGHSITLKWVKGHNGDPLNEEADLLATSAKGTVHVH